MEVKSLLEIPLGNLDLLLLDLDNTLYEYKRCHQFALKKLVEQSKEAFGMPVQQIEELYYSCREIVHKRHHDTAISHSRLFYIQAMVEKVFNTTNIDLVVDLYRTYWSNYIEKMELFDDAIPFLESCISKKINIVMVTDMTAEVQFEKIKKLGISKYFQFIVTSEEAGIEKPDKYIFELAIKKAEVTNEVRNIAVVGDNKSKDNFDTSAYIVTNYHLNRLKQE